MHFKGTHLQEFSGSPNPKERQPSSLLGAQLVELMRHLILKSWSFTNGELPARKCFGIIQITNRRRKDTLQRLCANRSSRATSTLTFGPKSVGNSLESLDDSQNHLRLVNRMLVILHPPILQRFLQARS